VRIETRINAKFFPVIVPAGEGAPKAVVSERGHSAKLIDLSETGCAMLAGRGLKKNTRLKIDFLLTDTKRIVVLGIVVNISNTGDERVKRYHVMFTKVGPKSRNNILLYVYNIFGEREEEDNRKRRKLKIQQKKGVDELNPQRDASPANTKK
jgi:c-di-GMP-binding flagellar brake protein YcgR